MTTLARNTDHCEAYGEAYYSVYTNTDLFSLLVTLYLREGFIRSSKFSHHDLIYIYIIYNIYNIFYIILFYIYIIILYNYI